MYQDTAAYYDTLFPFNPRVLDLITGLLPPASSRILDIGCGTGKYVAALAENHQAMGIDPDAASIERAREYYPAVSFRACDLFALDVQPSFDLVFCIGNVIAHIPPEAMAQFIDRVHDLLLPGGLWIFHTLNWERVLEVDVYEFPVIERDGIVFTRHYREIGPDRVYFDTVLIDPAGNRHTNRIPLYPLIRPRIAALHRNFTDRGVFADYAKNPFRSDSASQVFIFQR